ncbi:MAG: hypothetical protein ACPGLV_11375 [Bacteroidia bacterium]
MTAKKRPDTSLMDKTVENRKFSSYLALKEKKRPDTSIMDKTVENR